MTWDDATRAQIDAARPDASTWLAANAGSGKTRVLTDRVARLLLDGVDPQQILCLTYTKAAASEMQNRLFKRLGEWAMLGNEKLTAALVELGIERNLNNEELRRARTLFAVAIEAPGGLKIQTIHSFCASLLRRFPLEAGVSPQFTEIEDRAANLLRSEIVDDMASGSDARLVTALAAHYTGEDFGKLTAGIVNHRDRFSPQREIEDFLVLLNQPRDLSADQLSKAIFHGGEDDLITSILPFLENGTKTDMKEALRLRAAMPCDMSSVGALEQVFLNGSGAKLPYSAKIGSFPTKGTRARIAPYLDDLNAFMERIETAREARLALAAAHRALVLYQFGQQFIARYEAAKQQRGWLDFDDLILKARALLTDRSLAAWVLYRIDGGIDHILVDEAQDTSPRQWDVVERLTDEFYSGVGARTELARTLFVVGDKKQSIYSFQGADPREFDRKSDLFEQRIQAANQIFQRRSLEYSFRSSNAILRLVDRVFAPERLPEFGREAEHRAFKNWLPGRVDLWPVVEKGQKLDDPHWTDPLDRVGPEDPDVQLAEQIADKIWNLTEGENYIPVDGKDGQPHGRRRITAGDFLILVQRRNRLFSEIIRACKAKQLPISGADRLKVAAELAVKDLGALLRFLATPDDSLSLATVLRSPLFGWTEQMLFTLASGRARSTLWEVLRHQTDQHEHTIQVLRDLRDQIDFLRPFELLERILTRHKGRAKLIARLGQEAEDGINALLTQALAYEQTDVPSLTGFIQWLESDDLEIKRQIDAASDQIRVMTVHGAKGLEAPIVILPDTGHRRTMITDDIIELAGAPLWKPKADAMPAALAQRTAEMAAATEAERLRLLYVAMTRAEKWLIVAAAGDVPADGNSWYRMIEAAMQEAGSVKGPEPAVLRFEEGDWDALPIIKNTKTLQESGTLEPVFANTAPCVRDDNTTVSPSDLGGVKALPGDLGEDRETALAFGTLVHRLLEILPGRDALDWPIIAQAEFDGVDSTTFDNAMAEVTAVLNQPELAEFFGTATLAEVPVTAEVQGRRFHGTIDRLLITDRVVTAVDFKTNRIVPDGPQDCPEGILRQMGAYARMLGAIYPNREIRTAILWTVGPQLMALPHNLVTQAFLQADDLDGETGHS